MAKRERSPVRVGVAGWSYDDWKGIVYPDPKPRGFDPLPFLARYLDLIEINSTFYRPARPEHAEAWARRVEDAEDFRFTAKLWRRFTHERGEAWTSAEVGRTRDGLEPLREAGRLDAVLVQFPWSFKNDDGSREWLGDVVSAFERFPLVVEVRHESWNDPAFYAWLGERGVGFVNVDQPLFKRSIKPSARSTGRIGYVRVHGRNYQDWFRKGAGRDARYDYLYSPDELRPWVERTREVAEDAQTDRVDVVFNNHYKGQAVANALQFEKMLTNRMVAAPATLFDSFEDALADFARPAPDGAAEEAA